MAIYACMLWPGSTKQLTIRLFFSSYSGSGLRWFAVVCGGLSAFLWFHCLSSKILVVICGGLRWFVMVCGGLSFSHTPWTVLEI